MYMVYSTVESMLPYVRKQFCLCWPLSVLTLGCRYICSGKWTGGTLTCGLWSIQKAFKLLLTWLDWIYWDCSSPSLFFFFHPWLIRHRLCSFQAVRKTEGMRQFADFSLPLFSKKEIKVSWIYNTMTIGPDAGTFSVIFTENRAVVLLTLWVESGQRVPSSPDVWLCPKALNAGGAVTNALGLAAPAMFWDYFAVTCSCLAQSTSKKRCVGMGRSQSISLILSAASAISDYTPVTHGKHLGMTA